MDAFSAYIHTPRKTPLPLFGLENEFRGGIFCGRLSETFSDKQQKQQTDDECIYLFII